MNIEIKDREYEVETLRMALTMVGIGIDYTNTDLILTVIKGLEKEKSKFSLRSAIKIQAAHQEKWENYLQQKKQEEDESESN